MNATGSASTTAADPARTRMTPDDRRAAVLDAAIPLLVENGIGVTTRQIADAAGVAEGTLFRVFDDKRALLVSAIARALDGEPVVRALRAVDPERELEVVLRELADVLASRSAGMRGVMDVAHELRRSAAEDPDALLRDPHGLALHGDVDRPGSLAHAVHQMRTRAMDTPERIITALADALERHRGELRREPGLCARIMFSVVTSSFHDPLGPAEQLTSQEVVEVLLDGLRASHSAETAC